MDKQTLQAQGYHQACELKTVPEHLPRRVEINGRGILICRQGEALFAVDEMCPHKQRSMMYGVVMAGQLTCPHHQYRFDLANGRCHVRKCPAIQTFELEVDEEAHVWVKVP